MPILDNIKRFFRFGVRYYTAATTKGNDGGWLPTNRTADALIKRDQKLIMARCRDLARNNPYVKGALRKICDNVVRNGIRPQVRLMTEAGKPKDTENDILERLWKRWSRRDVADVAGQDSIAAIQKLVLRHMWADGELLVHRVWDNSLIKQGLPPFRIEILECDLLAASIDGELKNGNIARRGIEYGKRTGRPVAYHLYASHPGDYQIGQSTDIVRVPAADILHIFDRERASQSRGVSWMACVVLDAYALGEYQGYEMDGARLAASFGAFIKSEAMNFPGVSSMDPTTRNPVGDSAQPDPNDVDLRIKVAKQGIQPGGIHFLAKGDDIEIAGHNRPGDSYEPFVKQNLKGISAGVGTSYSTFSNDYADSSYAADRSAKLEERLGYQGQQMFLNEKLNDPLWNWFLEGIYLAGLVSMSGYATDPHLYVEAVEWQNPGWDWVDPLKDSKSAQVKVELGIATRRQLMAERGLDYREVMTQRRKELEDELELLQLQLERQVIQQQLNETGAIGNATDGSEADDSSASHDDYEEAKMALDAYGVGVRAGAITPQKDDEVAFRDRMGLPVISDPVDGAWSEDDGFRRPITLSSGQIDVNTEGKENPDALDED